MAEVINKVTASEGDGGKLSCSWMRAHFGGLGSVAVGIIIRKRLGLEAITVGKAKSIMLFPTR